MSEDSVSMGSRSLFTLLVLLPNVCHCNTLSVPIPLQRGVGCATVV